MPKHTRHLHLPSLKKLMIRQCIVIGALVSVLTVISLLETTHISRTINSQLSELQEELVNTQQKYNTHLDWNNLTHQISHDSSSFQFEFELLTLDPDHGNNQIEELTTLLRQHYETLTALSIPASQQDNFEQLKKDLWILEDIGRELLDTHTTNAQLWLYRDSIEFVDAIKSNTHEIDA